MPRPRRRPPHPPAQAQLAPQRRAPLRARLMRASRLPGKRGWTPATCSRACSKERHERLEEAASEARAGRSARRAVLDKVETITAYAQEMSEFLATSELTESKAFIRSFIKEIAVAPGAATIRYTIPMPEDSPLRGGDAEEVALGSPRYCLPSSLVGLKGLNCELFGGPSQYEADRRTLPSSRRLLLLIPARPK